MSRKYDSEFANRKLNFATVDAENGEIGSAIFNIIMVLGDIIDELETR